jgi:hypothetical protein
MAVGQEIFILAPAAVFELGARHSTCTFTNEWKRAAEETCKTSLMRRDNLLVARSADTQYVQLLRLQSSRPLAHLTLHEVGAMKQRFPAALQD